MKIIKVQAKIKEPQEKFNFLKAVWLIIRNRKQTDGTLTSGLFGGIVSMFFNIMAIVGMLISVCGLVGMVLTAMSLDWSMKNALAYISAILLVIFVILLILCFSLMFRAAANEMQVEEDRNYIISVFSAVVSFAALIVALVALLKGVG